MYSSEKLGWDCSLLLPNDSGEPPRLPVLTHVQVLLHLKCFCPPWDAAAGVWGIWLSLSEATGLLPHSCPDFECINDCDAAVRMESKGHIWDYLSKPTDFMLVEFGWLAVKGRSAGEHRNYSILHLWQHTKWKTVKNRNPVKKSVDTGSLFSFSVLSSPREVIKGDIT